MNRVILLGRLTRDPEVRYSQSSEPLAIAKFTVAVNRRFKRDGEPDADFIPCTIFGKQAEFVEKYFKKGMMISLSGRIQVRSWDDQQTGQKRWSTDVIADEVEFAESKSSFENRRDSSPSYNEEASNAKSGNDFSDNFSDIAEAVDDDDLPF